jgi:VWFA-related protein
MRLTFSRAILLGVLLFTLIAPVSVVSALAQAQQGPQKPPAQQAPPPQQGQPPKKDEPQQGQASISIEVPLVNVDVVATTSNGDFITGLKRENFRIIEDGAPQTVTNFSAGEAPITIVILMEFSKLGYEFYAYNAREWSYNFLQVLRKDDWVGLISFDLHTRVENDFTQNKQEVADTIAHMYFPGFSEANLFDALTETVDRLKDVKGKKAILLLASGFDTFSKHTLDQTFKRLRQTDVTIFSVGMASEWMVRTQTGGGVSYMQAENQMRNFAEMTGGNAWFPRFQGEIPGISKDVATFLRNQYSLGYTSTNTKNDGKTRKIKVELVNPDGSPLTVTDQKGKKVKVVVYARKEYTAPASAVVGD